MKVFLFIFLYSSWLFAFEHGYDDREIKEFKAKAFILKAITDKKEYPDLDIFVNGKKIATYPHNGGVAKVKEIVLKKEYFAILIGWKNLHHSLGINGVYYQLDIYKKEKDTYLKLKGKQSNLFSGVYPKVSKKGFDGSMDYEDVYFTYQSKKMIKEYLQNKVFKNELFKEFEKAGLKVKKPEDFFVEDIDIDKDGTLDKVVSARYASNEDDEYTLYFFKKLKDGYKLVYKGRNYAADGGNQIVFIEPLYKKNQVLKIKTYFSTRGFYMIEYFISYKNNTWYMDKTISYISYNRDDKDFRRDICTINYNQKINDVVFKYIPENERDTKCEIFFYIKASLKDFIKRVKDYTSEFDTTQRYKALLEKYPLSKKTLLDYNNLAYYLQKRDAHNEAIFILEKIVKKYPNRIVSYYNLGDSYWIKGKKAKAKKAYKKYIELMKKASKEKRIPQKVKDRVGK